VASRFCSTLADRRGGRSRFATQLSPTAEHMKRDVASRLVEPVPLSRIPCDYTKVLIGIHRPPAGSVQRRETAGGLKCKRRRLQECVLIKANGTGLTPGSSQVVGSVIRDTCCGWKFLPWKLKCKLRRSLSPEFGSVDSDE
jgi:hypothetical protein